jgi:predicted phosphate transport protein (TIGR00153 family)
MVGGYLTGIFGSSPVRPLQTHMTQVVECVTQLAPFFEAVLSGDTQARQASLQKIVQLEQAADELKKELRLNLPTSLFMPVDRRDMLQVLTMQDKVAGVARDIAGLVDARDMALPAEMREAYMELLATCIQSCTQAHSAISELDELIETGFDNSERKRVNKMLNELDDLEHQTDQQAAALSAIIMGLEASYPPVQIMFLYRLIDLTAKIADCAQRVGSRLQLTLAR